MTRGWCRDQSKAYGSRAGLLLWAGATARGCIAARFPATTRSCDMRASAFVRRLPSTPEEGVRESPARLSTEAGALLGSFAVAAP
jgi:hypothetical protein